MAKKYLLLLIFACLLSTTYAQIHIGATTSVTANAILDKGISEDPRYTSQYTINVAPIGFHFGWDITPKFGLQLESILANQDQIYKIVDAAEKSIGERKLDMQYLQLPMMMKFMGGGNKLQGLTLT